MGAKDGLRIETRKEIRIFDDTPRQGESTSGVIHSCDLCGRRGRWTNAWSWYGSEADLECGVVVKTCGCQSVTDKEADSMLRAKRKALGLGPRPRRCSGGFGIR